MEEKKITFSCADCGVTNCNTQKGEYPSFCLTTHMDESVFSEAMAEYKKEEMSKTMCIAADVEYESYCKLTRVQETIEYAKKMGFKKLGIATCVGLINETRILAKILRSHDFEVYGIACKVGAVKKTDVGVSPKCMEIGKNMCNPILQAKLLNKEKTELNIMMGLCVGHDSLFYRYSDAPVTTMVVKDRVTGHNPAGPLYTSNFYYKKLFHK